MSDYNAICDICGNDQGLKSTYGGWHCDVCGQEYLRREECTIRLDEEQLTLLRSLQLLDSDEVRPTIGG